MERGYDVTRYALNCFGGAGGQHACLVADALGMTKVLIHPFSGLLSAYGMGLADIRAHRTKAVGALLNADVLAQVEALRAALTDETMAELAGQGVTGAAVGNEAKLHLRYEGTDTALPVTLADHAAMIAEFEDKAPRPVRLRLAGKAGGAEALEVQVLRRRRGHRRARPAARHGSAPGRAHRALLLARAPGMRRRWCCGQISAPAWRSRPAIVIEPKPDRGWSPAGGRR